MNSVKNDFKISEFIEFIINVIKIFPHFKQLLPEFEVVQK
jgi:hypothetical protein